MVLISIRPRKKIVPPVGIGPFVSVPQGLRNFAGSVVGEQGSRRKRTTLIWRHRHKPIASDERHETRQILASNFNAPFITDIFLAWPRIP